MTDTPDAPNHDSSDLARAPKSESVQLAAVNGHLFRWLMSQKNLMIPALLFAALGCVIELVPYYLLWQGADAVLAGTPEALWSLAGWLAAALVVKYFVISLAGYLSHTAAFKILYDVRRELIENIQTLPLLTLRRHSSAAIKKILINDVERVENFVAHHTVDIVAAIVSPLVAGGGLFWLDWRVALCALIPIPIAFVCQMVIYRGSDDRMREYLDSVGELNAALLAYVKGIKVMKVYGKASQSFAHLDGVIDKYHRLVQSYIKQSIPSWSAFVVILNSNTYFILPIGLWLLIDDQLSVSTLLLFMLVGTGLLRPLLKLTMFTSMFMELRYAIGRLVPLLEKPEAKATDATSASSVSSAPPFALTGVGFSIGDAAILKDIELTIDKPGLYGIVGMSGSGKSTLASLLAGLVAPSQGQVALFGVPITAVANAERAKLVNVVTQDAMLFKGSLRLNLTLGDSRITDDAIWQALQVVQLADHVAGLPQILATDVGELGATLSGGEKQRIALARGLLADAKVMILDEATAFADAITERRIYEALQRDYADKVIVSIVHRLHAVKDAKQILLMADGKVTARGSHQELLASAPLYKRLWDSQFKTHDWHIKLGEG